MRPLFRGRHPKNDLAVFVNYQATIEVGRLGRFRLRLRRRPGGGGRDTSRNNRLIRNDRFLATKRGWLSLRSHPCRCLRLFRRYGNLNRGPIHCHAPAHPAYHPAQKHRQRQDRRRQSAGTVIPFNDCRFGLTRIEGGFGLDEFGLRGITRRRRRKLFGYKSR